MNERFKKRVIDDCRWYAKEYNCTLLVALDDWEGDGPNGSWGLTRDENKEIEQVLLQEAANEQ